MPFIPNPDTVKVAVEYLMDGQELANIFHVDVGATVTEAIINLVLDEVVTWLTTELMPNLSDDCQVTAVTGRDVSSSTGMLIERPIDPFIDGGQAAGALPNNVALCATWFTPLAGRSYRGRTYIPGLDETNVTLSRIAGATATGFAIAMIELVNLIDAAGYALVVASYFSELAPRVTAVNTPITAVGVNTVVDSQRRRLPGRGT